jgi:uncharacterized protein YqhQ
MKNIIRKSTVMVGSWLLQAASPDHKPDAKIDFAVGGQAVIEGIMMRSPNNLVIAVRKKAGHIKYKKRNYQTLTQRYRLLNIPILRGIINLFEMMGVGTSAINFSANEMIEDEMTEEEKEKYKGENRSFWAKLIEGLMYVFSFVIAIALAIFLFKFLPLGMASLLENNFPYIKENYMLFNLIDGLTKILIFITYIYALTLGKSFRRLFEYHGAEHKSIFAYEKKLPLTVENAKKQTRFHPRCGTSFIFVVILFSILVYTVVPRQETFVGNLGTRIALLPFIAGISYEYLKLSAKYANRGLIKLMIMPGLWFQKLTTSEPDDKQIEVGLGSLKEALEMEKG